MTMRPRSVPQHPLSRSGAVLFSLPAPRFAGRRVHAYFEPVITGRLISRSSVPSALTVFWLRPNLEEIMTL